MDIEQRITQLKLQLNDPEILDKKRIEIKLEAYKECFILCDGQRQIEPEATALSHSVVRRFYYFNGKGVFPYCWHIRKGKSSYTDGTDVTWFISFGYLKVRLVSEY